MRPRLVCLCVLLLVGLWAEGASTSGRGRDSIRIESVYLQLIDQVELPAQGAGLIAALSVREGARVELGQVLVELDAGDARLALDRSRLDLNAAQAAARSEAKLQQARAALAEAAAMRDRARLETQIARRKSGNDVALRSAKRTAAVADSELRRAQTARREVRDSVSDNELDHLQLAADKARFEVEQAEQDHAIAGLGAEMKEAEQVALEATVDRRQGELQQAQEDYELAQLGQKAKENAVLAAERELARHSLRSPIAGEVAAVHRRVGEWVEPGDRVVRVLRLDRLRAEGFLPAAVARRELVGRAVKFVLDGEGQVTEHAGVVVFVSSEIDPVNEQTLIWAEIENPGPDFPLQPGLRGRLLLAPVGGKTTKSAD